MDREAIYSSLPVPLQSLALNIEGRRIEKRRYAEPYSAIEHEVVKRASMTGAELHNYQAQRLARHLACAAETSFWRKRFADYGVVDDSDDPFGELSKLPVLMKQDVKSAPRLFLNPRQELTNLNSRHTSGTTGSGLVFWETRECELETWATWWRYRYWHGLSRATWCGYFGGRSIVPLRHSRPPFWRKNWAGRQFMFSAYHLSEKTAGDYLKALADNDIKWVHGYPSVISLLAKYKLESGIDTGVSMISFGAESLTDVQRETIERAFPRAKLIQHYGQAEAVANISQCPQGGLHVDEDFSWVEFVEIPDQPGLFRIVGTNWTNPAFPLLRYDTGDVVSFAHSDCACGSAWRVVSDIDGRIEDFVELPNGAKIGRLDHIFKDMVNITEAQIRQDDSLRIVILVVKGPNYSQVDETTLISEAGKRLGNEVALSVEYTSSLSRTAAGKLRLVVRA